MTLHWREGWRRAARVTGIGYAIVAVLIIGAWSYDHGAVSERQFTLSRNGQAYLAWSFTQAGADQIVDTYLATHRQPAAEPSANPIPTYDPWSLVKKRIDPELVARNAGEMTVYWLAFYVVLWAAFRSLRWIGRGLLDGARDPSLSGARRAGGR